MVLYTENGEVALDTEEFIRNIRNIQSNELKFNDNLKAYQVQFELEEEIERNLERGLNNDDRKKTNVTIDR